MPWEKSFDEQDALEKAMLLFWQKGFEPTSMADLINGIGINRGSLYNAFGSKQSLFVKALLKYDDVRKAMLAKFEALDDPKRAIALFFDEAVSQTVADQDHKGCFLFNTALDIGAHDETVQGIVSNGVREIEAFFRRSIEVGQARKDISTEIDPESTAKALIALVVAIRVLGRGVFAKDALEKIANEAKQLVN